MRATVILVILARRGRYYNCLTVIWVISAGRRRDYNCSIQPALLNFVATNHNNHSNALPLQFIHLIPLLSLVLLTTILVWRSSCSRSQHKVAIKGPRQDRRKRHQHKNPSIHHNHFGTEITFLILKQTRRNILKQTNYVLQTSFSPGCLRWRDSRPGARLHLRPSYLTSLASSESSLHQVGHQNHHYNRLVIRMLQKLEHPKITTSEPRPSFLHLLSPTGQTSSRMGRCPQIIIMNE